MQRVFVTGIGIISSVGFNVKESLDSLLSLRSGIGKMNIINSNLKEKLPVGEIHLSDDRLKDLAGIKDQRTFSRTSLLAMIAAKEALANAAITDCSGLSMGLIGATSVGGMDKGEIFYQDYFYKNKLDTLDYASVHDCGDSNEALATELNITDFVTTISTACSSSANAIMQGAKMIKAGLLDKALVGGADALTLFTLNGFNSLMILSDEFCKPFDKNRKGLNLGEGAAYLVLESESSIVQSGKTPLAEVRGYGNACDAFHQTASSAEGNGAMLAMTKALDIASLRSDEIDYINVHGTGTPNNDLSEGKALERVFKEVPPFSSTKSYTGHTLAAAGAIEAVFSVLSIQNGIIFPNLNFKDQIEDLNIKPEIELKKNQRIQNVLSNSFGFGGNNTSLIFSKC